LAFAIATEADAAELFALKCRAAESLTLRHGLGHWSSTGSVRGVARGIRDGTVLVAREGGRIAGALSLQARKPWAIDLAYFTPVARALYLVDMRVDPARQGHGIGRQLLEAAVTAARARAVGAIRLDAYESPAGAGAFYAKCGFSEVGRAVFRSVPLVYFELILDPDADPRTIG
jgi:GNAT superfamily N-acetyltransferase